MKNSPRYILKGIVYGAIVGVVAGHPLFMVAQHLHHYFSLHTPLNLTKPILRSFSLEVWPLTAFFALTGAAVGAALGRLYHRLEAHRLDYQARLRALAAELSLVEERERRRLSQELHEEVGQILAVTQVKLGTLATEVKSDPGQEALKAARGYVEDSIRYIRSLTGELSPPALYDLGFAAGVAWLARQLHERYGIEVELKQHPIPWPPCDDRQILLFIILRDLMTYVARQVRPREIKIVMQPEGNNLRLQVQHDGADTTAQDRDHTLFSIRERLDRIQGSVTLESPPAEKEGGAVITLRVPLCQDAA